MFKQQVKQDFSFQKLREAYKSLFNTPEKGEFLINEFSCSIENREPASDQIQGFPGRSYPLLVVRDRDGIPPIGDFELISPFKRNNQWLRELWSKIALTPREGNALDVLRLLNPSVLKVGLLEREQNEKVQILFEGENKPWPINRLGEGYTRLFTIAVGILSVPNGYLLIDEIDTGLHHGIMNEVWNHIFRISKQHNVQIFATTHSADCVKSFAEVGSQKEYKHDARLIRLYRKNDQIGEVDFDIETVQAAVQTGVEMR